MPVDRWTTSIALCSYNGEKYLQEQLDSFANNSVLPDELVVCDDNSTDGTIKILQDFAKVAPFNVRIFVNEANLGSARNFEKAISLCNGDIIFLSDQDDVWDRIKIETIRAEFDKGKEIGLVYSNAEIVDASLRDLGVNLWDVTRDEQRHRDMEQQGLKSLLFYGNYITGATLAVHSRLKDALKLHPVPAGYVHDRWISILAHVFSHVIPVNKNLVKYRQHSEQQIGIGGARPQINNERTRASRVKRFDVIVRQLDQQAAAYRALSESSLAIGGSEGERRRCSSVTTALFQRKIQDIESRLKHFRARRDMPPPGFGRLVTVSRELGSGRYFQYSRGLKSVALDLVER